MRTMPFMAAAMTLAAGVGEVHADGDDEPKADEEPLSIGGRVFTRYTATSIEGEPWEGEVALDSARVTVNYLWKEKVRTKVSVEAAGTAKVKDAFVELDADHGISVRAGHYRIPISSLENEGEWTLPTIDRGVVAKALSDGITLTGRRDAVEVTWEAAETGPRVMAAVSQSVSTDDLDPARALSDGGGIAATLRVEHDVVPGVRIGAIGSNRETIDGTTARRYWAAGSDAQVDLEEQGLGLRLWADVLVGTSHLGAAAALRESTTFVAAQVAAGWRFGGEKKNKPYIEPYLLGGFMNPSIDKKRDDVSEIIGGVAAGRWKRWRGQGQLSYVNARAFRPPGLGGALVDVNDAITVTVQLGAAF